jgi:hypothetical protein
LDVAQLIVGGDDSWRLEVGTAADRGTRFRLLSSAGAEHFFEMGDYARQEMNYGIGLSHTSPTHMER